ncbi:MAG: hypothetical protein AAGH79_08715 [Bacteroidota bacterium]
MKVTKQGQLTGHRSGIYTLQERPTKQTFISGAGDGWVAEWPLAGTTDGNLLARIETQIFSMLLLENEQVVVLGNMEGGVHWVDLEHPEDTLNIAHHQGGVFGVEQLNSFIWTLGGDGLLTRWDLKDRKSLDSQQISSLALRCMAYCESRNEIAIGASDHAIYFLDAQTLRVRSVLAGAHANSVFTLLYSPDGQYLYSGGRDAHLKMWALEEDRRLIKAVPAHWYTLNHLVFIPELDCLVSGSRDKTLKIWNPADLSLLKVLEPGRDGGHVNSVNRLLWLADAGLLVSASDDRSLILWEVSR